VYCMTPPSPDPSDDVTCDVTVTVNGQTVRVHAFTLCSLRHSDWNLMPSVPVDTFSFVKHGPLGIASDDYRPHHNGTQKLRFLQFSSGGQCY